jgi:hypothetical protein
MAIHRSFRDSLRRMRPPNAIHSLKRNDAEDTFVASSRSKISRGRAILNVKLPCRANGPMWNFPLEREEGDKSSPQWKPECWCQRMRAGTASGGRSLSKCAASCRERARSRRSQDELTSFNFLQRQSRFDDFIKLYTFSRRGDFWTSTICSIDEAELGDLPRLS